MNQLNTPYPPSLEHLMELFRELPVKIVPFDRKTAKDVLLCNLELEKKALLATNPNCRKADFLRKSIRGIQHELEIVHHHIDN